MTLPDQGMVLVANVYDRHKGGEGNRPAQKTAWGEIAKVDQVVIAGDMNAYSKMWNSRTTRPSRNNVFRERVIRDNDLLDWNMQEETRMGAGADLHSIIDLTLRSPGVTPR